MSCHVATASCQFRRAHTLSQGILLLHLRALRGLHVRALSLSFILECTDDMDSACPVPGHRLTVEMLPGLARAGRSYDSTPHESSPIQSRLVAGASGFTKSSSSVTLPQ